MRVRAPREALVLRPRPTDRAADRREGDVRLLLISHYYAPEIGAAQTRLRETVAGLVRRGFDVTVIAPVPSYPLGIVPAGYHAWLPKREVIDGVSVARLPTVALAGASLSRRLVGQAAFATASLASHAIADRFDVALIESPPLPLAMTARSLALHGLPYVFHVADPWPDFPIAMGYLRSPLEQRLAFWLEDLAYRGAAAVTTVSPGLVALLEAKPSAAGKVELIPNGVDVGRFTLGMTPATARGRLGWDERFTVVYAGTVGLAQGVGTLLDAARMLDDTVAIRIVGEGLERPELERRARAMGLRHVVFQPAVQRTDVPVVLAAAEAGLVILRRGPLYEDSLPTKLLETMAAGRPVVVSADGLAARIVREAGAGYIAEAGDPQALARAIDACRQDAERAARGEAARAHVLARYERESVLDRLADVLRRSARTR
jgi:glycosyltransferase involved in cell wall biosynthesis